MDIRHTVGLSLLPTGLLTRIFTQAAIWLIAVLAVAVPAAAQNDEDSENLVLEEVIVTGMRQTLESAQNIKFNSDTIVDSIVADDIANLPDRSVTEMLQRIPGVTIDRFISRGDPEHFGGEGSGVAVRGLTQVRGEINGQPADAYAAGGRRAIHRVHRDRQLPELPQENHARLLGPVQQSLGYQCR